MNNLLRQILEEKNEKNIFSLISQPKKDDFILWPEILENFQVFLPYKSIDKRYFWGNDLNILERFGFDIDFEDSFGNTLLFHLFSNTNNKTLSFENKDILKRTKKLCHINRAGENILFFMASNLNQVSWENVKDFVSGKNLIDFIEQHPQLDIHQFNNSNKNILNYLLINMSFREEIFDYLVDKGVSTNHIDKDGYNLLNIFPIINFKESVAERFLALCQNNDITNETKHKESCVSTFISFISSLGNHNNEESHISWLNFIFNNIISGDIPVQNKEKLITILDNDTSKYSFNAKKIIPLQHKTVGFLKYKMLDEKFPEKNIHIKKPKI